MKRHRWVQHPDAPARPYYQICERPECQMQRFDLSDNGIRWEYRDRNWRFLASRKMKHPAPPCGANKPGPSKETNT